MCEKGFLAHLSVMERFSVRVIAVECFTSFPPCSVFMTHGQAAVLMFSVWTAAEKTVENVKHKHSSQDIICISSVKGKQSAATGRCFFCGFIAPGSLSPNTMTLSPWGRQSKHTHSIRHTHSFTMCHRANYQQSGCKRSRVIQVSIPEPPLGPRIRSQKIVRDAEGWQSDSRQQHMLLQWRLRWV